MWRWNLILYIVSMPVFTFPFTKGFSLGVLFVWLALILFLRCCENHFIQMPNKLVFWKRHGQFLVPPSTPSHPCHRFRWEWLAHLPSHRTALKVAPRPQCSMAEDQRERSCAARGCHPVALKAYCIAHWLLPRSMMAACMACVSTVEPPSTCVASWLP